MKGTNDTGTKDTYQSYQLFKDDKLIASIATYDPEGDQQLQAIFSSPQGHLIH